MTGTLIPFTAPEREAELIRDEFLDAVNQIALSGSYIDGPFSRQLESQLVDFTHFSHAILTSSGTTALELVAQFIAEGQIGIPSTVVVPALTFVATANAFARHGFNLKFADVDVNGIMDNNSVEINDTDLLVPVGLFGSNSYQPPRSSHIGFFDATARVEDGAQNWISAPKGNTSSAWALAARTISFDPTKNISAIGNGGAIVTNNTDLAEFTMSVRKHGFGCDGSHHTTSFGTNARMTEIECASVLAKFKHLNQWQARRARIASYWTPRFEDVGLRVITRGGIPSHDYQKFVVATEHRDHLAQHLSNLGIQTKIHYRSALTEMLCYSQPSFLSVASSLARQVLSLPMYPLLTDNEVERVGDAVVSFFKVTL